MATDTSPKPGFFIRNYGSTSDEPLAGVLDIVAVLPDGQRLTMSIEQNGLKIRTDGLNALAVLPNVSNSITVQEIAR